MDKGKTTTGSETGRNFKKEGTGSHSERDTEGETSDRPQSSKGSIKKYGQGAGQNMMEKGKQENQ